jgi:8-oxo-dGTP pyrophosphatase MutT (NUDIX family)
MIEEYSAGGVILKQQNNVWHVLLIKDMNGNWTFPKGIIDPGENDEEAAKREIQEEVGLTKLSSPVALKKISYWYVRGGDKIHKTVSYFLFTAEGKEQLVPQKEEGISDVQWMSKDEAIKHIGYPKTNIPLLRKAFSRV